MKMLCKIGASVNDKTNTDRVVLEDIYIDGKFFRDHVWVHKSKRFSGVKKGDVISATVKLENYHDPKTNRPTKVGIKHIRNLRIVDLSALSL
jgi:hypothetical protein